MFRFLRIERPTTQTLRPTSTATSTACCIRCTFEANEATRIRPCRCGMIWRNASPTRRSEPVTPGRSALVESARRRSIPRLPNSASRPTSVRRPSPGVDDDRVVPELVDGHVLADLAEAAERDDSERFWHRRSLGAEVSRRGRRGRRRRPKTGVRHLVLSSAERAKSVTEVRRKWPRLTCSEWGPPSLEGVPRRPRNLCDGIYHLAAHGSDSRYLFVSDRDREDFLDRLSTIWQKFELALLSYVLLGNHYHVLVRIPDARLSRALQRLHTEYSRWHNRRHGRSAHLFRAHEMTQEITSDAQLVAACRYLARNPVGAGLVDEPLDWPWSSARAHARLERPRIPLADGDLRAAFGGGGGWRERYRARIQMADGVATGSDPPAWPSGPLA